LNKGVRSNWLILPIKISLFILIAILPLSTVDSVVTKGFIDVDDIFSPTGTIYNNISIDNSPSMGDHKITYNTGEKNYDGIYWQYPEYNWDDINGRDLRGVNKLEFWARAKNGSEKVIFSVGYPYSNYYTRLVSPEIPNNDWKKFEILLSDKDLQKVAAGFGCLIYKENNSEGCTIYLKDIRFVLA
jgi:hypothetical protein